MILIVDDKKENLFSLKTLLELHRFTVETASSGEDALRKILKTEYALIILDVQMPGMDGYEVAETITGYSKSKNTPIIFLSAVNIDKRFITKGYASGGVDYVTKPFDPDLLLLKVKTFCRLSEQTRELKEIQGTLKAEVESRRQAQQALAEVNGQLEDKVAERTAELLQINKALEISNAELQQYASLASHDLQEPLRKIITFGRLIQEEELSEEEVHAYIQKIISGSERMRSLINDLLNYSKLSVTPQFEHINLSSILKDTTTDLELAIREKNAVIESGPLPQVEAIPGQMRQVFQNIISNALKFSKQGIAPHIKIWSEATDDYALDGPAVEGGKYVRLCISDNGIGFNEAYREKIFNMFQRLHSKAAYEGTGIGLAIVKKIVEKHGGLLTARSKEGEGTTFVMVLPAAQKTAAPVAEANCN